MPMIETKVNIEITKEQEQTLAEKFGTAVAALGKSERYLMLRFEEKAHLYFQGKNSDPIAFVNVQLFGKASDSAYDRMTKEVTEILNNELHIAPDHIYVKYEEVAHWGHGGFNL